MNNKKKFNFEKIPISNIKLLKLISFTFNLFKFINKCNIKMKYVLVFSNVHRNNIPIQF